MKHTLRQVVTMLQAV